MAGLMDNLIETLEKEEELYLTLIPLAEEKAGVIIENDLKRLSDITEKEQEAVSVITNLEKKRAEIMKNMGIVLNRKNSQMKLDDLIALMSKNADTKERLINVKGKLHDTLTRLKTINNRNEKLIRESLNISEYHLNMIRSERSYIGNNYTRHAGQFDMPLTGMFDMKN